VRDSSRPLGGGGTRARSASGGCSYGDAGGGFLSGEHKVRPQPQRREFDHGACRGAKPLCVYSGPPSRSCVSGAPKGDQGGLAPGKRWGSEQPVPLGCTATAERGPPMPNGACRGAQPLCVFFSSPFPKGGLRGISRRGEGGRKGPSYALDAIIGALRGGES